MERLKRENLVESIRGKGTFVIPALKKQTKTVLIFGMHSDHPYEAMAVSTISAVLQQRGYVASVEFYPSLPPEEQWEELLEHHENLFGIIVIGRHANNKKLLRFLHEKRTEPVVLIGDGSDPLRKPAVCNSVAFDNRITGYVAADYLIRAGHERIITAIVGAHAAWGKDFIQGCVTAFTEHGLEFREEWSLDSALCSRNPQIVPLREDIPEKHPAFRDDANWVFQQQEVERQVREVLRSAEPPTALICNMLCEAKLRDVVHNEFQDRFAPSDIVVWRFEEGIWGNFTGYRNGAVFVSSRFSLLVERAIDILSRSRGKKTDPAREIIEDVHLYRHHEGHWEKLDIDRI
jgi:DNA-binding LacI/PurR family transcriptional regulator